MRPDLFVSKLKDLQQRLDRIGRSKMLAKIRADLAEGGEGVCAHPSAA